jgi:transposase
MAKKKRRKFSAEFKAEAVRIVHESGKTVNAVSKELGVAYSVLRNWVRTEEARQQGLDAGGLTHNEREELIRLRRENKRLKMEQEILKKAAAFFARESRNDSATS